ncbi:Uncharacterized protein Adt_13810 [Abeliophyllum distichum]|uniref:Reverse transcriptase Ty1/copia-type domain-containing protein n=1 Tax=Abeliophyllum distichum TaxID=126358 RepID=A0ABD1TYF5_9LAMI
MPEVEQETEKCRHPMMTRLKAGIVKPKAYMIDAISHCTDEVEPGCLDEALKSEKWYKAYDALIKNQTWILVPPEPAMKIIGCKWVYKLKFVAVSKGCEIRQVDINNAFLNGKLEETFYMEQPHGFVNQTEPSFVCKLSKAIYGLKHAPELVYVDDIILIGNCGAKIQKLIEKLNVSFALKDMENLKKFLGIEFYSDEIGLHMLQKIYAMDILKRIGFENLNSSVTPMAAGRLMMASSSVDECLILSLSQLRIGGVVSQSRTQVIEVAREESSRVNEIAPQDMAMIVTFLRGYPVSESKVRQFFSRSWGPA